MAAEPFNSQGGYTSGIPPIPVIDSNGNVITNVVTTGNVIANNIFANEYRYGNGQPLSISAAGSNTQVQYNSNGVFGASSNFTFSSSNNLLSVSNLNVPGTVNFSNVSNVKILGGVNGYFLQTDGLGNLTWAVGGNGGNGSPGGSNTQVQFNDNELFGGSTNFTFNKTNNTLSVTNIVSDSINTNSFISTGNITANYFIGNGSQLFSINGSNVTGTVPNASHSLTSNTVTNNNQPNINSVGTLVSLDVSGNINSGNANLGNLVTANYISGVLVTSSQPNITSVGTLTGLNLVGPLVSTSTINTSSNINSGNINVSRNITANTGTFTNTVTIGNVLTVNNGATLNVLGNINAGTSQNVYLGSLSNIHIDGGLNGYVISTDGNGNLSWTAAGGGNGAPGGSNTQVQFNDVGSFAGSAFFTFNKTNNTLNVAGNLIANTLEIGSGAFRFCKSNVYFATTVTTANTVLLSLDANTISSVDFTVIATDSIAGKRQVSKLSAVVYNGVLNYNEYSTLLTNGLVANITVGYVTGNIITPDLATLYAEPATTNNISYKIQITQYAP